jgi:hypothetical protein
MIMRRIEKGERKGEAKVWSYPGMEKAVQQLRKKIDGVSELFTLDACRHGGMTELEEAELTDGQGRALSGHKTIRPIAATPRKQCSARWRQPASGMRICWRRSSWKFEAAKNSQMAGGIHFQVSQGPAREQTRFDKEFSAFVRPETWVTFRTGHMGNTFRLLRAGGVDAVESEFGRGRAPSLYRPPPGRRGDDGCLPGVRHIS